MSYPQFEQDLYGIYKCEVLGEALFSTAASPTFSAQRNTGNNDATS